MNQPKFKPTVATMPEITRHEEAIAAITMRNRLLVALVALIVVYVLISAVYVAYSPNAAAAAYDKVTFLIQSVVFAFAGYIAGHKVKDSQ